MVDGVRRTFGALAACEDFRTHLGAAAADRDGRRPGRSGYRGPGARRGAATVSASGSGMVAYRRALAEVGLAQPEEPRPYRCSPVDPQGPVWTTGRPASATRRVSRVPNGSYRLPSGWSSSRERIRIGC
jgi:hypothetical protein